MGSMRGMNTVLLAPQPDKNSASLFEIIYLQRDNFESSSVTKFRRCQILKKHNWNADFEFYEMRWNSTYGMKI